MSRRKLTSYMGSMISVRFFTIMKGKRKYSIKVWKMFVDVFNAMPLAALIQDKIFCMHGGIGPDLNKITELLKFNRPMDMPVKGIVTDLLWSDPAENLKGFA